MFYKVGKKIFQFLIEFIRFIQVSLIFLSFFIILYWILQLAEVTFIQPVSPFFKTIKDITHIFYQRVVEAGGILIDFSFLIAAFFFLFCSWGLKFAVEYVEMINRKYDLIYNFFKKKAEILFNIKLEQEYLNSEKRNNNFLILIRFSAINLSKDSFYDKNVYVGVEEKQKEILNTFNNMLKKDLTYKKKMLKEGLLLYFDDFNTVDKKLFYLKNVISNLKQKYRAEKWLVEFLFSIETFENARDIYDKTQTLIILNNFGLKDKILCLSAFKQRYSLIEKPKYSIIGQGVYKIKIDEEVFSLKT